MPPGVQGGAGGERLLQLRNPWGELVRVRVWVRVRLGFRVRLRVRFRVTFRVRFR